MENNELMHHGVPGMKWGKRKAQANSGNLSLKDQYKMNKKAARLKYKQRMKDARKEGFGYKTVNKVGAKLDYKLEKEANKLNYHSKKVIGTAKANKALTAVALTGIAAFVLTRPAVKTKISKGAKAVSSIFKKTM